MVTCVTLPRVLAMLPPSELLLLYFDALSLIVRKMAVLTIGSVAAAALRKEAAALASAGAVVGRASGRQFSAF